MPSYLSFAKVGTLPDAETPAQRTALDALDDVSDHTVDTYARIVANTSRAFPRAVIEVAGEDGDSGTPVLFRARGGRCDTIWFEKGAKRSARDKKRLDEILAPKPRAPLGEFKETLKLGFPRAMNDEIVGAKRRGTQSNEIIEALWERVRPKLGALTAAQIEATVRPHFDKGRVAAHYFVGARLRKQLKKAADTHGVKVSVLLTYAWATTRGRR